MSKPQGFRPTRTLEYFQDLPSLRIVYGCGSVNSKPYDVVHLNGQVLARLDGGAVTDSRITYVRHNSFSPDPRNLISNPYDFLLPVPPGMCSFADAHGPEIFDMVTLHCLRLVEDSDDLWSPKLNAAGALAAAKAIGEGARKRLLERLAANS